MSFEACFNITYLRFAFLGPSPKAGIMSVIVASHALEKRNRKLPSPVVSDRELTKLL